MRKLREYKGVTFKDGHWRHSDGDSYSTVASLIVVNRQTLTDDDHAELMRLKAEPYEKVPRLEDVVRNWTAKQIEKGVSHLPLSSLNYIELVRDIRTAFPHIDQEER